MRNGVHGRKKLFWRKTTIRGAGLPADAVDVCRRMRKITFEHLKIKKANKKKVDNEKHEHINEKARNGSVGRHVRKCNKA